MPKEYDNTNRFVLFQNDRKEKDTQPDYKGEINIGGKEYWLSGWKKLTGAGKPMLSGSIEEKKEKQTDTQDVPDTTETDQSIPF